MYKKITCILLLVSNFAMAENAVTVHTGDIVKKNFDNGTLVTREQANKIKEQLIEADANAQLNVSYENSINLYKRNGALFQEENRVLLDQNIELTKALNETRKTSTLEVIGYIVLGGAIMYGASRITRP